MPRANNASPETPAQGGDANQPQQAEQEQPKQPTGPMIRFVGRDSQGRKVNPPTSLHGVVDITDLPDANEQRAGFRHEQYRDIVRGYPTLYKRVKLNESGQPLPEDELKEPAETEGSETADESADQTGDNSEVKNNG